MKLISNIPFLSLWLIFSLIRIGILCIHYLRSDPYGMPMVARVDRFLPFGILVEIGAIALIVLPFAVLKKFRYKTLYLALTTLICYQIVGLFDLEIYRFLKQHATFSFLQNYFKPSALKGSTLLLSVQSDIWGLFIFILTLAVLSISLVFSFKIRKSLNHQTNWIEITILFVIGITLGSSLSWLNPSHNRYNRLLPPLYIYYEEVKNTIISKYTRPSDDEIIKALHLLKPHLKNHMNTTEHPFTHFSIENKCKNTISEFCDHDEDYDGFSKKNDCDDLNNDRHPNATETPSDAIDQNCSGIDSNPNNIIFLVGESFNQSIFNTELNTPNRLNNIHKLLNLGGKYYPNAFSNGFPSVYGAASIYLGIWNHPDRSIFGEYTAKYFKGFPEYLPKELYQKFIVSGADPYFDNQAFWFNKFYDKVNYDKDNGLGKYNADEIVFTQAIEFLRKRDTSKSFFLTINNHTTHTPFKYPSSYKKKWLPKNRIEKFTKALDYFDIQLGRLLQFLEKGNLLENTVFVLIGDHGMAIETKDFELPEFYGFEKSATVAGVFSANPLLFTNTKIDSTPVSQVDIGPTILDIVGVDLPTHFIGKSLLKSREHKPVLFVKNGTISLHSQNATSYFSLNRNLIEQIGDSTKFHTLAEIEAARTLIRANHFLLYENKIWNPNFD